MKKLALLIVCMFCFAITSLAAPVAPQMSYSLNGTNITVDWSSVPGASGYTLYYAAYPYAPGDYIGSLDRGNNNSYSINLWDGAAYYIATTARNTDGSSGYSNIEYFIMTDHHLDWEDKATLSSARTQFAGGVINDKIYSFGGYGENEVLLNSLEIYDPETDLWASGASSSQSVADLSGVAHNDKLYVFGATGEGCSTTNFSEKYDPNTDQWTSLTSKTTTASGSPAVAYNNKIYLFGGWEENTCDNTGKVLKKNVEIYNPSTDNWQPGPPMPRALEGAAVAVYDNKAYLMGGVDVQGNYATEIIAYDFASESWIESGLGSLNAPRLFSSSTAAPVIEDTILLVGGWVEEDSVARSATAGNLITSNRVEFYSPRSRTVTVGAPLPEATAGHLPVVVDGDLLVIGGQANEGATATTWKAEVTIEAEIRGADLESDSDSDGFTLAEDCNDHDQSINPGATDICEDGIDQDCDGVDLSCPTSIYNVSYQMLRHDNRAPGNEVYRGYVALTKSGEPVSEEEFLDLTVSNSAGASVPLSWLSALDSYSYIPVDCRVAPCSWGSQFFETGVSFNVETLPLDDYTITIDMAEEQISTTIPYSEDITVPFVRDSSMQAVLQEENIVLTWENPITEPDWDKVTELRINIYGPDPYLSIKVSASDESITLPASLFYNIGTQISWRVFTRVYTGNVDNPQNSRGWSSKISLSFDGRLVDNNNGTVTDNITGLIWQQSDDDAERDWYQAGTYCEELTLGGSTNWRLPTDDELLSIVDTSMSPMIDAVFVGTNIGNPSGAPDYYYWSSTPAPADDWPDYSIGVDFSNGYRGYLGETWEQYVRCVR